jgi:uncharacterized protein YqjF (DUF2071 family)
MDTGTCRWATVIFSRFPALLNALLNALPSLIHPTNYTRRAHLVPFHFSPVDVVLRSRGRGRIR